VDLDDVRDPLTGVIEPAAQFLIDDLSSYTEVSPSGTGVHILCRGVLPPGRRRVGRIEMYQTGRYFTITGQHVVGTPLKVEDRVEDIAELHAELFPAEPDLPPPAPVAPSILTDAEIIARAFSAKNGEKFKRLWLGDWQTDYHSQSEAVCALCCKLAFWCGNDAGRIDALFRQSALMCGKWIKKWQRLGESTIEHATNRTPVTYTIPRREIVERILSGGTR
jgi:putative DNA primase/helicase